MRWSWRSQLLAEEYAQRSDCGCVGYTTSRSQVRARGNRCRAQTPSSSPRNAMSQPDNSNYVRRVVLPSGRAIEVVYFENQPAHAPHAGRARRSEPLDLHVCPECDKQPRLPGRVGGGLADALGGPAPLPELRVDRPSGCTTRRPSTASTRSSTTAPRRSSATSSASRGPTWRRRSSASRAPWPPTPSGRWTSRLARRTGRRPSRPPAPAPRAAPSGSSGRSAFAAATISSASVRASSSTPVAAIASHTASACAGVRTPRRSSAASSGSRSRARMNGSVTVPSSRSVPRCLPVRSAGPETSSTSSSSWNASPMRRPKSPSALRLAAALERAEPARRLEQPRGLEVAAVQVALARDLDVPRVLALQQLALGERRTTRPTARGSRPGARSAPARRTRARTAGRRSRWRSRGRRSRRRSGGRGAAARRRARRRGPASRSGSARPRPRRAATPSWFGSARLAGGEEDEQRPQPLAAGADRRARVLGEQRRRATWRAPPGAPRAALISAGTCAPPASTRASTSSALLTAPSRRGAR